MQNVLISTIAIDKCLVHQNA